MLPAAHAGLVAFGVVEHEVAVRGRDVRWELLLPRNGRAEMPKPVEFGLQRRQVPGIEDQMQAVLDGVRRRDADELQIRTTDVGPQTAPLPSSATATPPHQELVPEPRKEIWFVTVHPHTDELHRLHGETSHEARPPIDIRSFDAQT